MGTPASGFDKIVQAYTNAQKRKFEYEKEQAQLKGELLKERSRQESQKELARYQSQLRGQEYMQKVAHPTLPQQTQAEAHRASARSAQRTQAMKGQEMRSARHEEVMRKKIEDMYSRGEKVHPGLAKKYGYHVKPEKVDEKQAMLTRDLTKPLETEGLQTREKRSLLGQDWLARDVQRPGS